ncbi:hypothetical protein BDR05DRAFT_968017 [Suillus weaverae]|nr:hypothetical protein BDR05DRAFT_968017 [Suillus weaverae]
MITRLYAMYQQSRKMLIFLVVIFLADTIFNVVVSVMSTRHTSGVWVAVKHFRELRQHSTGGVIEDCITVLIKSHVFYFLSFVAVSCFNLMILSPTISVNPNVIGFDFYYGTLQVLTVVQMFVLGPRLILGIRDYTAKLVTNSDAATAMTSIAFQERVHISTGSGV